MKIDLAKMSPPVVKILNRYAEGLKIPVSVVIDNLLIARLAEEKAREKVYGPRPALFPEFAKQDGELMRGEALFKMLTGHYVHELERERFLANPAQEKPPRNAYEKVDEARERGLVPADYQHDPVKDLDIDGMLQQREAGFIESDEELTILVREIIEAGEL